MSCHAPTAIGRTEEPCAKLSQITPMEALLAQAAAAGEPEPPLPPG